MAQNWSECQDNDVRQSLARTCHTFTWGESAHWVEIQDCKRWGQLRWRMPTTSGLGEALKWENVGKIHKYTEYIKSPLKIMGLLTVKPTHAHGFVTPAPKDTRPVRIPGTSPALLGKQPRAVVFKLPSGAGPECLTAEGSISGMLWEISILIGS